MTNTRSLNLLFIVLLFSYLIIIDINAKTDKNSQSRASKKYPNKIVDTGQLKCYNNTKEIPYPKLERSFFGQDAEYQSNTPFVP